MFISTIFSGNPHSLTASSCNDHRKASKHDDLDTVIERIENVDVNSTPQSQSAAIEKKYAHMYQPGLAKKTYSFKISDNGNHQKSASHAEAAGDNLFSKLPPELTGHISKFLSPLDCMAMESLTGKLFLDKKTRTAALNSQGYYEEKGFTEKSFDKLFPEWKKLPEIKKLEAIKKHSCFPYFFHNVISTLMGKYKLTAKKIELKEDKNDSYFPSVVYNAMSMLMGQYTLTGKETKRPLSQNGIPHSREDHPSGEDFLQKKRNQAFNYEPFRDWFSRQAGSIVEAHMLGHNENNFVAVTNEGEISIVGKDIRNTDSQIPAIVKKERLQKPGDVWKSREVIYEVKEIIWTPKANKADITRINKRNGMQNTRLGEKRLTVNQHNPNQFLIINGHSLKKTHKEEKSSKNEKNVPKGSIDIYSYEESANESDTNYQLTKISIDLEHFPVMAEFSSNGFLIVQIATSSRPNMDKVNIYKKIGKSYEYTANVPAYCYALHDTTIYSTGGFYELNSRRTDREDVIYGGKLPLPGGWEQIYSPDAVLPVDGFVVSRSHDGYVLCDTKQLIDQQPTDSRRPNYIEHSPVKIRFDNCCDWEISQEHPLDFSMRIKKSIDPAAKVYFQIIPEIIAGKPVKEQRARVNA